MTILEQPSPYNFAGNLPDILIESAVNVDFKLRLVGDADFLIEETYTPDSSDNISIQIREFFENRLAAIVPPLGVASHVQTEAFEHIEITIDAEVITFYVIAGGGENLPNFLGERFLTWQPPTKSVKYDDVEWLTFLAKEASGVFARIYHDAGIEVLQLATMAADTLVSTNVSPFLITVNFTGVTKIEVYVATVLEGSSSSGFGLPGTAISALQIFTITDEFFLYDDLFVFANSLGGIDSIRFTGALEQIENFGLSVALYLRNQKEYLSESNRSYAKKTGVFRYRTQLLWSRDFFGSILKYRFRFFQYYPILTTGNLPSIQYQLSGYEFQFTESEPLIYQNYFDFEKPERPLPPNSVNNLQALGIIGSILLSWPSRADYSYRIMYSADGGETYTELDTVGLGVDEYDFDDAASGLVYYFYLISIKEAWESGQSNVASAMALNLPAPTSLSAIIDTAYKVDLSWTNPNAISNLTFEVQRSLQNVNSWTTVGTTTLLSLSDTTTIEGTYYSYRVRAILGSFLGDWSSLVNIYTPYQIDFETNHNKNTQGATQFLTVSLTDSVWILPNGTRVTGANLQSTNSVFDGTTKLVKLLIFSLTRDASSIIFRNILNSIDLSKLNATGSYQLYEGYSLTNVINPILKPTLTSIYIESCRYGTTATFDKFRNPSGGLVSYIRLLNNDAATVLDFTELNHGGNVDMVTQTGSTENGGAKFSNTNANNFTNFKVDKSSFVGVLDMSNWTGKLTGRFSMSNTYYTGLILPTTPNFLSGCTEFSFSQNFSVVNNTPTIFLNNNDGVAVCNNTNLDRQTSNLNLTNWVFGGNFSYSSFSGVLNGIVTFPAANNKAFWNFLLQNTKTTTLNLGGFSGAFTGTFKLISNYSLGNFTLPTNFQGVSIFETSEQTVSGSLFPTDFGTKIRAREIRMTRAASGVTFNNGLMANVRANIANMQAGVRIIDISENQFNIGPNPTLTGQGITDAQALIYNHGYSWIKYWNGSANITVI